MVNNTTHLTPYDARKPKHQLIVKDNLEAKLKRNRLYPDIDVGNKVKIDTKSCFIKNILAYGLKIRMKLKVLMNHTGNDFLNLKTMYVHL